MTVLVPVVACGLIAAVAPLSRDDGLRRIAAYRIVPAETVGNDRAEDPPHIGIKAVACGQLERVLAFERVRRVVALKQIDRIVEEHADIGAARRDRSACRRLFRPM